MENAGNLGEISVIAHALSTSKFIALIIILLVSAIVAIFSEFKLYKAAENDLILQNKIVLNESSRKIAEEKRQRKIISEIIQYNKSISEAETIDVFTKELVNLERDGDLSIIAQMNSFGKYGAKEPTILLDKSDIEVFRPLFWDGFDVNNTPTEHHEVVSIEPLEILNRSAVVILVLRHIDLFHTSHSDALISYIENIRSAFKLLIGANVDIGIYVFTSEKPNARYFIKEKDKFQFSPHELDRLPIPFLLEKIKTHNHPKTDNIHPMRPHVEYILNKSKKLYAYDEKYVAILLPGDEIDTQLKRNSELHNFVQFFGTGQITESPTPDEQYEQYGILQFVRGMERAYIKGDTTPELRAWAGQYAEGYQSRYKLQWKVGDFDPSAKGRFVIRFNYQHFDEVHTATLSVLYAP